MARTKRQLEAACAFFQKADFACIQKMCKLQPTKSWRRWVDIEKNILTIKKTKDLSIRLEKEFDITNDILIRSSINRIVRNSFRIGCVYNSKKRVIFCLGNDHVLRGILSESLNISGLRLGKDILQFVANNWQKEDVIREEGIRFPELQDSMQLILSSCSNMPDEILETIKCMKSSR